MKAVITGELIQLSAQQLHHIEMNEARAAEIARDLARVSAAVLIAEAAGDFNDEPGRFAHVLAQLQSAKPAR